MRFKTSLWLASLSCIASFGGPAEIARDCYPLDWVNSPQVPSCPTGGSQILSENYPPAALVISDHPYEYTSSSESLPARVVLTALEAAGDKTPFIFLPVGVGTYQRILAEVEAKTAGNPEKRKRWLAALRHVEGDVGYTWQQDYYQSTFDRGSGAPVLRHIPSYERDHNAFPELTKALESACPHFKVGPDLGGDWYGNYRNDVYPRMGGNIEGLPGGIALTSPTQAFKGYADGYANSENDILRLDASFLHVGHVDELVKTLPTSGTSPCNFVVAIGSPRKAIDLLRAKPNMPYFKFQSNDQSETVGRYDDPQVVNFCREVNAYLRQAPVEQEENPHNPKHAERTARETSVRGSSGPTSCHEMTNARLPTLSSTISASE